MAKLITSHDPYHIHKILGVFVLIHFLYRFYNIFTVGNAFPVEEHRTIDTMTILLHGILSCTSLLLPLPAVRNYTSPMIWPEFRFHSILFASRHVICTVFTVNQWWPMNMYTNALVKGFIVGCTSTIASWITTRYGSVENRTTNSMPYPSTVTVQEQGAIKMQYINSQFGATLSCIFEDATLNYVPLLGIQMAPLLMTLVRKGKIETVTYHRVYAFTLWLGYVVGAIRSIHSDQSTILLGGTMLSVIAKYCRLNLVAPLHILRLFSWNSDNILRRRIDVRIIWLFVAMGLSFMYAHNQYIEPNVEVWSTRLAYGLWIPVIVQLKTYSSLFFI